MSVTDFIIETRRAGTADRDALSACLTAAFFDDPVVTWLVPDDDRRRRILDPLFGVYVDAYLPHGETYITSDGGGAAVWLTPGGELFGDAADAEAFGAAVEEIAGADGAARFGQLEELFGQYHPEEPLYYCQFLATVPAFQSRGIGSTFLREMLARADRDCLPAYHEATTLRNRALYERHGYVSQGVFNLPDDGPPLWRMWREPRPIS
jgi:GNAT superfamily N-acetyltransferase